MNADILMKPSKYGSNAHPQVSKWLPQTCCCCFNLRTGILIVIVVNIVSAIVILTSFALYYLSSGAKVWYGLQFAVTLIFYIVGFFSVWKDNLAGIRIFTYWYCFLDLGLAIFNTVFMALYVDLSYATQQCATKLKVTEPSYSDEQLNQICLSSAQTGVAFAVIVPLLWKFYISAVVWSYWKQQRQYASVGNVQGSSRV